MSAKPGWLKCFFTTTETQPGHSSACICKDEVEFRMARHVKKSIVSGFSDFDVVSHVEKTAQVAPKGQVTLNQEYALCVLGHK